MSISAGSPTRSIRSHGDLRDRRRRGSHARARARRRRSASRALEAFAREHWDVRDVTHRWSAQDPVAYDQLPVIGPYVPGSSRLSVASGFMKWGLTGGTFAAMILRDRIGGAEHPWAATFAPNRVSLRSAPEARRDERPGRRGLRRRPPHAAPQAAARTTCRPARRASCATGSAARASTATRPARCTRSRCAAPTSAACCASTAPRRAGTARATARASTSTAACSRAPRSTRSSAA